MVTGQIKLGANKELSRNSLSRDQLEGFFYGGGVKPKFSAVIAGCRYHTVEKQTAESKTTKSNVLNPARQHLTLQTLRAVAQWSKAPEMSGNRGRSVGTQSTAIDGGCGGSNPTCSNFNFYDIPSRKRVARCTNILPTGTTLSGVGEGQRLRKGFQGQQGRGSLTICGVQQGLTLTQMSRLSYRCRPTAYFESLSSAAEIRLSSEKYEVKIKNLCLACTHK